MTEQIQQKPQVLGTDEIDLRELFSAIWAGKWFVLTVTIFFAVASVFYALSLPNIYKSEVLLAPVDQKASINMPGQLGGLAALAGVNLNGGGGDKTSLALEILRSREFLGRFINQNDLLIPLMASQNWSRDKNMLDINPSIFDTQSQQWIRKVSAPYQPKPSLLEAHEAFLELLSTSQDKETGMVKISIQHYSPFLAQQWVSLLVKAINDEMRLRELSEAQSSISYLNDQIAQTNIADVRLMLFSLVEEQTKTVMLANVRDEYVFKTVDPPVVAERKMKPSRALICIVGVMLGGMLSVLFVLVRYFNTK